MSHKTRITDQFGRYYTLKSLQPLNLSELQYLEMNPSHRHARGFFCKCVESFRANLPRLRQWAEDLLFEPVESTTYSNTE